MKDKLIRRRVMVGAASNFIGQLFIFLLSFLLTPFFLSQLGAAIYGLWILIGSIVAYGAVLDFGIWGTIIKHIAHYHAQGDDAQARRLLSTILRFYLLVCALMGLVGFALAPYFPHIFGLPPEQHDTASLLVILMSWATGLALPCMIPLAVLRGLQRYDIVNLIDVTTGLYTAAAAVVVLLSGGGVIGLVLVHMSGLFVMYGLGRVAVGRIAPELYLNGEGERARDGTQHNRQMARAVFAHSWPLFVQDIAHRLHTRTDEIVIGLFLPVSQVGAYNIARRLSETTQTLTRQFMKTLLPLASQLHAEQDLGRLRTVYKVGARLTLALVVMLSALLVLLAGPVLTLWVGAEYAAYAGVVAILTLANLIVTVRWSAVIVLQAMARHRILALSSLGAGLANLALTLLLVRWLGLTGVALGTALPIALEYFCVILPYSLHVTGVQPREMMREVWLPALLPALPMLFALYGLRTALAPDSLLTIAIISAAGLLVYLGIYLPLARGVERRWLEEMAASCRRAYAVRLNRMTR